ncbi:hypothetical protein F2Q69_00012114 [Brassica cretica]|uniref:Uncharacterized protein n=1 Tax=Brassica cretica TaxID=69181 RepID=A0A8S9R2A0_BRACR|nr:hypothetical protein F2Q69_00012114 [Brassica cretica]
MLGSSVTESSEKMLGSSVKMVPVRRCWFGYESASSALTVTAFDGAVFDDDGAAFEGDGAALTVGRSTVMVRRLTVTVRCLTVTVGRSTVMVRC